ncbi:MAG: ThiF family adenylyltransferase, partial [Candidatus Micrarchaeota archaeon]
QKRVGNWMQSSLEDASVLVVGAGALGNEAVKLLLQLGVSKITLADHDTVATANLNRCVFFTPEDAEKGRFKAEAVKERALDAFPLSRIITYVRKIEEFQEDFFSGFDAAFSCLDNLNARLHLNAHCYGKFPVIDGGTFGFQGKVQVVKGGSSCLECSLSKVDYRLLWKKYSCVGDFLDVLDPKMPALSTTTSFIASLQVNEFLKLQMPSLGAGEGLAGRFLLYDGLMNSFSVFSVPRRRDCPAHPA